MTATQSVPATAATVSRATTWILGLTVAAQFVLQLDFSIVNVALPTVQHDLHFSPVGLQWVVTGYALTFGSLLLVGGRLGDIAGHRRALVGGLIAFAITSLSGGLATSAGVLVASRLVQGASAALIAPAALGLLTHAYTEPAARARALGIFQGGTAAGGTAGIVLGGILTEYAGWRWVLLVNPPVIVVLVILILRKLPATPGHASGARVDVPGAATATAAIAALIYGVSSGQEYGFSSPRSYVALAAAVVLAVAFVVTEARTADPMLPPALLRDAARRAALSAVLLLGTVFAGYVYFISLYLQHVLHFSAVKTGIALVPATLTALVMATQVARRVLPLLGPRRLLLLALTLLGGGQLWLAQISAHGTYSVDVLGGIMLTAAGLGLALPTASLAIVADVPPHQRGVAGGMFVTTQQVGAAVGLAALATVAATRTQHTGTLVSGYQLSYWIATALMVIAVVLVALLLRPRREQAQS